MATPESSETLKQTALYELLAAQKARFTPFAGWKMPVQFGGLKQEHEAVRTSVGMFDISHMGKFALKGKDLLATLQNLVPTDLGRLEPGKAQYTVLLNEQGGIIDDLIIYDRGVDDRGEENVFTIVNAATKAKDKAWIEAAIKDTGIELADWSDDKVLIALQGPHAEAALAPFVKENLSKLGFFSHADVTLLDSPAFIARTGYTGEDGFEIMVDPETGKQMWQSLMDADVTPCGLGARDTLRLEAALALYGQDITEETTPLEAGLGWLVHLDRQDHFNGREVLVQQKAEGVQRKLVGIQMEGRYIARHGYPVLFNGEVVGEVTSGTISPTLGNAIALAYVPTSLSRVGQVLDIEIRGKTHPATVVKKPFYRSPHR
ncbi:MAG: glycine cleavage system aminomethyltransferase GcvT [Jaaginema sp. PMC 1079.18]|nr:glycine cleavage system aminomethyltransferase GcvT [Jaaginema sp. PMC 1080.18]MEC4853900.1 glycine cleavage system aminomethyltransferase GcvT [Jaaginema sp. PMC 1079.18]MEC4868983.1 glycine cleavage system aminomethyltransferase GcvT [Jaaginema sp. PMC 1078.18]